MRLMRVGYLALGLAPQAVPALAQEVLRLFAPAPHSAPAPSQPAKAVPMIRAALNEARVPLRSAPQMRGTLAEVQPLRSAQDTQPQLRR
jgi:hypothetical protein